MVYLKSPLSQLSKTFFWIENQLNIKEVMNTNVYVICINCVDIHSIECIRSLSCIDSIDIYNIDGMVEKTLCLSFPKLFFGLKIS